MYYPEARIPSETDLRLIEGAGHIAVIAIEGERSQQALRSAFEEIRNSETKLQQDERELRQLIDFLPQHIVVMDKDGTLLQANKRLLDYLGFPGQPFEGCSTCSPRSRFWSRGLNKMLKKRNMHSAGYG